MNFLKLIVMEHGDESVGLSYYFFSVESPFTEDMPKDDKASKLMMDTFKKDIIKTYQDYTEQKVTAYWEYESKYEKL